GSSARGGTGGSSARGGTGGSSARGGTGGTGGSSARGGSSGTTASGDDDDDDSSQSWPAEGSCSCGHGSTHGSGAALFALCTLGALVFRRRRTPSGKRA
ncbi:MAG TPA: MYXO-CTERM sorting domain-containing protein, partial [Polyangiaceae bacterium]|nr:MYXO-CTERM sorting domain-containing protein [Polyangiaceae bacterium]